MKTEKYSDDLINGKISIEEVVSEVKKLTDEPDLIKLTVRWVSKTAIRRRFGIGSTHSDVYYSRTAKMQAHFLVKHFGDEDNIKEEVNRMNKALGFRPALGLKQEVDKLLNNK